VANDRAIGINEPLAGQVSINGLPCGKRTGVGHLYCMRPVESVESRHFDEILNWVRDFDHTIESSGICSRRANEQKSCFILKTNLSAVTFERGLSEPRIVIARGTGNPISRDSLAIYLRLPLEISRAELQNWARTQANRWFGNLLMRQFLDAQPDSVVRCPGYQEFYRPDEIRISNGATASSQRDAERLSSVLNGRQGVPEIRQSLGSLTDVLADYGALPLTKPWGEYTAEEKGRDERLERELTRRLNRNCSKKSHDRDPELCARGIEQIHQLLLDQGVAITRPIREKVTFEYSAVSAGGPAVEMYADYRLGDGLTSGGDSGLTGLMELYATYSTLYGQ
jgi:hypothetical protein